MRVKQACRRGLVLWGALSMTASGAAAAVTITKTGKSPDPDVYQLDGQKFSSYSTVNFLNGQWVNRGNCNALQFSATVGLPQTGSRHTFNVALKLDGKNISIGSDKFAVGIPQEVSIKFDPVAFAPGEWTIAWDYQRPGTFSGSQSIRLMAPSMSGWINLPDPGTFDATGAYCSGGNLNATYQNGVCFYRPTPPTGFIYHNAFYRNAAITLLGCPVIGTPTSDGFCLIGNAPGAYVHDNALHFRPLGATASGGLGSHSPPFNGGICPPPPTGSNFSIQMDAPWGCKLVLPPTPGQGPATQGDKLLLSQKRTGTCSEGSFDGAHCLIGAPPPGSTALQVSGNWIWTGRFCN